MPKTSDALNNNAPLAFFNSVHTRFKEALQKNSVRNFYYRVGGYDIQIQFAGDALIPSLSLAFQHLQIESCEKPDLTLCVWDSESTETPMVSPPWKMSDFGPHGEIQGFNSERFYTAFHHGEDSLNLLDIETSTGIYWLRDPKDIPYYTKSAPLRYLFHWWLSRHGRQLVHGGAVGSEEAGALIVGMSGSGKSTTALSCLDSRLFYAGDDYVIVDAQNSPTVYSLYQSAKLDANHSQKFPNLTSSIINSARLDQEKAVIMLGRHFKKSIKKSFPLKAILIPKVGGRTDTSLHKVTPSKALVSLAPSTLFQLPREREASFKTITRLVKKTPCYQIELGSDLKGVAKAVEDLLLG